MTGLPTGTGDVVSAKIPHYPINVSAVLISSSFCKYSYEQGSADVRGAVLYRPGPSADL